MPINFKGATLKAGKGGDGKTGGGRGGQIGCDNSGNVILDFEQAKLYECLELRNSSIAGGRGGNGIATGPGGEGGCILSRNKGVLLIGAVGADIAGNGGRGGKEGGSGGHAGGIAIGNKDGDRDAVEGDGDAIQVEDVEEDLKIYWFQPKAEKAVDVFGRLFFIQRQLLSDNMKDEKVKTEEMLIDISRSIDGSCDDIKDEKVKTEQMLINIPRSLKEKVQRTTAIADKRLNKYLEGSLRYVDTAVEPWATQLAGLRESIWQVAFMEARVNEAIVTLLNDGTAHEGAQSTIISLILNEYVEAFWALSPSSDYEESPQNRPLGFVTILRITNICSTLRTIALNTTTIWCHLSLNWPNVVVSNFSTRSLGLSPKISMSHREGEFPPKASVFLLERLPMTREINLEILCAHSSQPSVSSIKTINRNASIAEVFARISHCPAPHLKELILRYNDHFTKRPADLADGAPVVPDIVFANCQNLRSLNLEGFAIPLLKEHATLKGLRFLSVRCTGDMQKIVSFGGLQYASRQTNLSHLHNFLSNTPDIERLTLELVRGWTRSFETANVVELTKCKEINILISPDPLTMSTTVSSLAALQLFPTGVFSALRCPQLSRLSITCLKIKRNDPFASYAHLPLYIHELAKRAKLLHLSHGNNGGELSAKLYHDLSTEESVAIPYCSFTTVLESLDIEDHQSRPSQRYGRGPSQTPLLFDPEWVGQICKTVSPIRHVWEKNPPTIASCQALLKHYPSITRLIIHEGVAETRENFIRALHDPLICPNLQELGINGDHSHLEEIKRTFSHRKANSLTLNRIYLFADISYNYHIVRQSDSMKSVALNCVHEFFTDCPDIV
ncbi:hypothetical protein SISNIDRAFT_463358 [Sistotremastrum niveocremeum HHB9708]|uniref:RNI-like protein n=1 Tax=Sistotremastrum niveocremeum HHB9708 TaxID=1314777 RepID=A0A164Z2D5_9AGAM|nr:hypothetical protein SISNIDRAFT_463358 [Sistotremastrum niveocremeum HHB9708]